MSKQVKAALKSYDELTSDEILKVADDVRGKFEAVMKEMNQHCIKQNDIVTALALATLSKQNLVMIGQWGSNKTRLIDLWTALIGGDEKRRAVAAGKTPLVTATTTFRVSMSKYSDPGELLGPIDLKEMMEGNFKYNLKGGICDADFAFIDEAYACSGAAWTVFVHILNERVVLNGGERIKLKLRNVFAATNEHPRPDIMRIHDRFLYRVSVGYIDPNDTDSFIRLLSAKAIEYGAVTPILTLPMLEFAYQDIRNRMELPQPVMLNLCDLRGRLSSDNEIVISDRRWYQFAFGLKAAAWLAGRNEVTPSDLWTVGQYVLWSKSSEIELITKQLETFRAMTAAASDSTILREMEAVYQDAMGRTGSDGVSACVSAMVTIADAEDMVSAAAARARLHELNKLLQGGA